MNKSFFISRLLIFLVVGFTLWNCKTAPLSNRRQVNLLPESILVDMSLTNYDQFLKENKLYV